ncbi:hypothetical protein ACJX0J_025104, partial [Zea mays]
MSPQNKNGIHKANCDFYMFVSLIFLAETVALKIKWTYLTISFVLHICFQGTLGSGGVFLQFGDEANATVANASHWIQLYQN